MYEMATIRRVFEKQMKLEVCSIHQFESVENNKVYRIETESQPYIFKIYKGEWPEDEKLLLVEKLLAEAGIAHAKIFVYSRDKTDFPHGYLIEECLPGATADRLVLDKQEMVGLFEKLGALVSRLHQIKMKGYGYTGSGFADWETFSEFMYDSIGDNKANLLAHDLMADEVLEAIGLALRKRLKVCDKYASVLCHTDLSTKNMMVNEGDVTLIDWDDVYSLCWVYDLATLTFWMKREYGNEDAEVYRKAFLDYYETEYDLDEFDQVEPVIHVRIGLNDLNYFAGMPEYEQVKQLVNKSLEKCGMDLWKCLFK